MNQDFESYTIDDEEEGGEPGARQTMWSIVPQIMVVPSSGWAKAKNNGPSPELATIRFLLPLCLLSGASVFFSLLYPDAGYSGEQSRLTILLVDAVISFCSFFIGYYIALVLGRLFMPKADRDFPTSDYGKLLIMTGIGTLAFFHFIFEALRMLDFILVFLPLWTIFIQFKGLEKAGLKSDKKILAIAVICLVTIGAPTLTEWVLALFV